MRFFLKKALRIRLEQTGRLSVSAVAVVVVVFLDIEPFRVITLPQVKDCRRLLYRPVRPIYSPGIAAVALGKVWLFQQFVAKFIFAELGKISL